MNLNEMATRVHLANKKWWQDVNTGEPIERNVGELLMLCTSELAEAMEGHRKRLQDDKLPHRTMFEVELADALIRLLDIAGGFGIDLDATSTRMETELHWGYLAMPNTAECLMKLTYMLAMTYSWRDNREMFNRGLVWCLNGVIILSGMKQCDLFGAYEEKMRFNATRADHQHEARRAVGGKSY